MATIWFVERHEIVHGYTEYTPAEDGVFYYTEEAAQKVADAKNAAEIEWAKTPGHWGTTIAGTASWVGKSYRVAEAELRS